MKVPFFTDTRYYKEHKQEIDNAILEVLERGDYILGKAVKDFEENVAKYLGTKNAIGVSSGSEALFLSLKALGIKEGDEVITTPFTFFASVSAIVRTGATPVFVDIDENTFNIDVGQIEEKITEKTKMILPVHLFLQTAEMDKINEIAKKYNLYVLEDAAEAFGMEYKDKKAGTISDIGIYSFYPTKTLGAYGDAGLVVTNNDKFAEEVRALRNHGQKERYYYNQMGYNARIDSIQAAILNVKLKHIESDIEKRKQIGIKYNNALSKIDGLSIPVIAENRKEVYYVYSILTEKRDELAEFLNSNGIGTSIYYPLPLHLQKVFANLGYKKGDFPIAEKISQKILALPLFPTLKDEEIDYVIKNIKDFFHK